MSTPKTMTLAFRQNLVRAASRNMYDELKTLQNEAKINELNRICDVFCGPDKLFYVFLKDGKLVELGRRKYDGTREAAEAWFDRAKKHAEEGEIIPSVTTFRLTRMADNKDFTRIMASVEKERKWERSESTLPSKKQKQ
jgi:hypothetical protein